MCNKQHEFGNASSRIFAFCDKTVDIRLAEDFSTKFDYFNIAVSEYQCIGEHDVGDTCTYNGKLNISPGKCILLQTLQLMNADVTLNYQLQKK